MKGKSKVKNTNYVAIQGWMINDLQLKGNDLLIYSIIYGFCQAEGQSYTGSLQYLADWTNSTKQGVMKNLNSLIEKGLIIKKDNYINGVKFCEYRLTEFNGGIKQSLTNNIIDNNIINNKESKKEESYNDIINLYTNNNELKEVLIEFIKMRKLIKKPLTTRAFKMIISKLDKLSNTNNEKIEIIEQSIQNDWQNIYPLKKQTNIAQKKVNTQERNYSNDILENMYCNKTKEKEIDYEKFYNQ